MQTVLRATPLYRFLWYCNNNELEKKVLDCGAGGANPPLSIFSEFGYETYGVEISQRNLDRAKNFIALKELNIDLRLGDMRELPFEDNEFSFIYSYNSIFHMTNEDIAKSVSEMERVLKPGGLCFVNFLSVEDGEYGKGEEKGKGEFLQEEGDRFTLHTYHEDNEPDSFFKQSSPIFKEKRIGHILHENQLFKYGFLDYIVKKG
jgi:ubiquinone/menaquinone biosynthesis C-methylase UbiE